MTVGRGTRIFIKRALQFVLSGVLYVGIETVFRMAINHAPTNPLVFFLGGAAYLICSGVRKLPLPVRLIWLKVPIAGLALTVWELMFGLYFNVYLGLNIWNYTGCGFELFDGQICLKFSLAWVGVGTAVMLFDLLLEKKLLKNSRFSDAALSKRGENSNMVR